MKTKENRLIIYVFVIAIISLLLSGIILPLLFNAFFKVQDELVLTAISQIVAYVIPIIALLFFTTPSDTFENHESLFRLKRLYKKPNVKELAFSVLFAIILFFVAKFFNLFLQNVLLTISKFEGEIIPNSSISFGRFILIVLVFALMPSLVEETFHRGILYQSATGNKTAFILSIIPFTLLHSSVSGAISAFIFSSFLFMLMSKSKNLVYMYIIHFIYDLMSLIFTYYITLPLEPIAIIGNVALATDYLLFGFISLMISIALIIPLIFILKAYKVNDETFVNKQNNRKVNIFIGLIVTLYLINFIVHIFL